MEKLNGNSDSKDSNLQNNEIDDEKGNNSKKLSNSEKKELKEYLMSVYEVDMDNITIN